MFCLSHYGAPVRRASKGDAWGFVEDSAAVQIDRLRLTPSTSEHKTHHHYSNGRISVSCHTRGHLAAAVPMPSSTASRLTSRVRGGPRMRLWGSAPLSSTISPFKSGSRVPFKESEQRFLSQQPFRGRVLTLRSSLVSMVSRSRIDIFPNIVGSIAADRRIRHCCFG